MKATYYLDTYAILEYLAGNKSYKRFFQDAGGLATSLLNLIELYYILLKEDGEATSDRAHLAFSRFQTGITDEDVKEGMKFRLRLKAQGRSPSYADAIGYQVAARIGAKYLTGDEAFRTLPNVEFVK
jgi:predicted nucleic acid-binding protein